MKDNGPRPSDDRKYARIVRTLAGFAERGDAKAFEALASEYMSPVLITNARAQKLLTRGAAANTRTSNAACLCEVADKVLQPGAAAEFARYAALCLKLTATRAELQAAVERTVNRLPKLSLKQLLAVAHRTFDRIMTIDAEQLPVVDPNASVPENERRIHAGSGYTNDVASALLRAVNEASHRAADRDLTRPDASARASPIFRDLVGLSGYLNSLEYALDSASFGDFKVVALGDDQSWFQLDSSDPRRALIRQLSIRRRLMHLLTGLRHERFVREQLSSVMPNVVSDALSEFAVTTNAPEPTGEELQRLEDRARSFLHYLDAEDDLLFVAGGPSARAAMLYTISAALLWTSLAADLTARKLTGEARRRFGRVVSRPMILEHFVAQQQAEAVASLDDLTLRLPARSHLDLIRRPFVQVSDDSIIPIMPAVGGMWTTTVREIANTGGSIGQRYGAIWEEWLARSFESTDWKVVGRNIALKEGCRTLTEVDLLLLRDDLLLVVEIKALTGSGLGPYEHWKSRLIIEKGCRQAALASEHLRRDRTRIAAIANAQVAARVRHIQPLVLTNEDLVEGWVHHGVPVAAERMRKAITTGIEVQTYDGQTHAVVSKEWHLRPEELTTETILRALNEPIELKLAPEQGAVEHVAVQLPGVLLKVPNLAVGNDRSSKDPKFWPARQQRPVQDSRCDRNRRRERRGQAPRPARKATPVPRR